MIPTVWSHNQPPARTQVTALIQMQGVEESSAHTLQYMGLREADWVVWGIMFRHMENRTKINVLVLVPFVSGS